MYSILLHLPMSYIVASNRRFADLCPWQNAKSRHSWMCPAMTKKDVHGPNLPKCWEMVHEPPCLVILSSCRAFHSLLSALIWRFCAISAKRRPLKFPRHSTYDRSGFLWPTSSFRMCLTCSPSAIYRFLRYRNSQIMFFTINCTYYIICVLISFAFLLVLFSSNETHPFLCCQRLPLKVTKPQCDVRAVGSWL